MTTTGNDPKPPALTAEEATALLRANFRDRLAAMQDGSMPVKIRAMREMGPKDWTPPVAGLGNQASGSGYPSSHSTKIIE